MACRRLRSGRRAHVSGLIYNILGECYPSRFCGASALRDSRQLVLRTA